MYSIDSVSLANSYMHFGDWFTSREAPSFLSKQGSLHASEPKDGFDWAAGRDLRAGCLMKLQLESR